MDKQQYEVMNLIMAKGRKFLDEIFRLMKENGLIDQGYKFTLEIDETRNIKDVLDCDYLLCAEFEKNIRSVSNQEYHESHFDQWNKDGKGWVYMHDPHGKTGSVQEDDYPSDMPSGEPESNGPSTGETAESAAESGDYCLWFHDDGSVSLVDGRGDLNGMAESDTGV